jgi:hypothetical protein
MRLPDLVYGAIAGVNGAACMSVLRLAARRANLIDVMPPQVLRESVSGSDAPPGATHAADHALHLGIGLAGGAAYAALPPRTRGVVSGALFGAGLWAVSILVLAPALGARRAGEQITEPQGLVNLLAHLAYGALLPVMIRDMTQQDRRRQAVPDRRMRRVG